MKKLYLLFILLYASLSGNAQAPPQGINYQAVAYLDADAQLPGVDANGTPAANQNIRVRFSILKDNPTGTLAYREWHNTQTDAFGLFNLIIGQGTKEDSPGNFDQITWSSNLHFLKVELDIRGGTDYKTMGAQQLWSVPYALYSGKSGNGLKSVTDNGNGTLTFTYEDGSTYTTGVLTGLAGQKGDKGDTGPAGPTGPQGTPGNGLQNGTAMGQLLYWDGNAWITLDPGAQAQTLTMCNGKPVWTAGGQCPGGMTTASCGAQLVHNGNLTYGSITDQQGNLYRTIKIDSQEWMAENLKTSVYRNGEQILNVTNNAQWQSLTSGAWCTYSNNLALECPYGKLYNWYAVADPRGLCPTGWHVPTESDWLILENSIGGSMIAGGKMKNHGNQYWTTPNTGATNESGFSGLPGGVRFAAGTYNRLGTYAYWWSSTQKTATGGVYRYLYYNDSIAGITDDTKVLGLSIRCLKD
jgi:uncharacterized protein (TIGR02145 family)